MKPTVLLLFATFLLPAQVFDSAVATEANLGRAYNNAVSTLASGISTVATSITLASASTFGNNVIVKIDDEIIKCTTWTAGTLTLSGCTRAHDGTTAALHSAGAAVEGRIVAAHHNALAAEVIAIETALGADLANVYQPSAEVIDYSNATSTRPHKVGTTLPATCAVGDAFFKSDATAGKNNYGCTAPDTWTLQGDGGNSGLQIRDETHVLTGTQAGVAVIGAGVQTGASGAPTVAVLSGSDADSGLSFPAASATAVTILGTVDSAWDEVTQPSLFVEWVQNEVGTGNLGITAGIWHIAEGDTYTSATVSSGTYTSGITATGTVGQTCVLGSFNGGGTGAAATVALTGTDTIAGGTALVIANVGSAYTSAPTSATASDGTATCSGTATVATVISAAPTYDTGATCTPQATSGNQKKQTMECTGVGITGASPGRSYKLNLTRIGSGVDTLNAAVVVTKVRMRWTTVSACAAP